jgi:UDP-N-acetylmuramoyl-tripeptide--D-alanyl-D-alanine ligase
MELTVSEIVQCTGGTLLRGRSELTVRSISTDTRTLKRGDVFLTLVGENFDGSQFIGEAIQKGAAGIITHTLAEQELPEGAFRIQVADPLRALGDIAARWRAKLRPTVVALTGSGGKTTTKEMVGKVLSGARNALVTEKNYNNLIGVPLMVLQLTPEHECAVLELGMNERGELGRLTKIVSPDFAALTNIGSAHIGKFGSLDGLLSAKAEMFLALRYNALIIVNADCQTTKKMLASIGDEHERLTFSIRNDADVMALEVNPLKPYGYAFILDIEGRNTEVELNAFGFYNVSNALCAAAILHCLGVSVGDIAAGLSEFRPQAMRSEIEEVGGVVFIKEYYNSNPASVMQVLQSMNDVANRQKSYVLLGDMLELGTFEERYHREVGEWFKTHRVDMLFTLGERAKTISDTARALGQDTTHFVRKDEAIAALTEVLSPGDVLLAKASRLMHFEEIIDAVMHNMRLSAQAGKGASSHIRTVDGSA